MELYHHGIKGQQWGRRRFQNEDGTLTTEGKARYASDTRASERDLNKINKQSTKAYADQMEFYGRAAAYHKKGNFKKEQKYAQKGDEALRRLIATDRAQDNILKTLKKNGHVVVEKGAFRHPDLVSNIIRGIIDPVDIRQRQYYRPSDVYGRKYKVLY